MKKISFIFIAFLACSTINVTCSELGSSEQSWSNWLQSWFPPPPPPAVPGTKTRPKKSHHFIKPKRYKKPKPVPTHEPHHDEKPLDENGLFNAVRTAKIATAGEKLFLFRAVEVAKTAMG